jgi:hypothetical protein
MAKTNEQFDQYFREKLDEHQEKPSMLAWERLESQLPKSSKPTFGVWWAVAASVTALLVAGYTFWPSNETSSTDSLVAEKTEIPFDNTEKSTSESVPEVSESIVTASKPNAATDTKAPSSFSPITSSKTKPTLKPTLTQTPQSLLAQAEDKSTEEPIPVPIPELKTEELPVAMLELKAPELEKTVALANTTAEEEPLYRVNIYSNGVKKGEAPEKNLINELGKTVGQVEGFLGKVDNGLLELQDKKDNLFSSLVSRKNQSEARR